MTFIKFMDVVLSERSGHLKVGHSFMLHLSAIKPRIFEVYENTYLDQSDNEDINNLVYKMTELIWDEN